MPRISVVIPTYRRPDLLLKCLGALAVQDLPLPDFEIIVVSDGPDAATVAALDSWTAKPANLRYLPMPAKKGPAAARNFGWQHAGSPLIAFTDDDTLPAPHWVTGYLDAWHGEPLAAFTGPVKVPLPPAPTDYALNTAGLETAAFVTANCACTRAALEAVQGFDERFTAAWREDSDLHFKLLTAGIPMRKIYPALVVHPVRAARFGVSIPEQRKTLYNALLYKKWPALYRKFTLGKPTLTYYLMVLSFSAGVVLSVASNMVPASAVFAVYLLLWLGFTRKRLQRTSHSFTHVAEMLYTSAVIPFASVYWHFYGLVRYGVWFV